MPHAIAIAGANLYALAAVAFTAGLGWATDEVIVPRLDGEAVGAGRVWAAMAIIAGVGAVRTVGIMVRRWFLSNAEFRTQVSWRSAVVDRYLDVPLAYHRARPAGELLAHAEADVEAATRVLRPLAFTFGTLVLALVAVGSLVLVDWRIATVALVSFPLLSVMSQVYTQRIEVPAARAQGYVGEVSAIAHESFDGVLVVKTLGREDAEVERLDASAERLREQRELVGRLRATFEPAIEALPNVGIVVLLALGAWLVSRGAITTGEVVQAATLFTLLAMPLRVVGFFFEEMPKSVVALDRVDRVLAAEPHHDVTADRAVSLPEGPLALELDRVSFGYDDTAPVLSEVSFTVAAGETVAVVGSTGAGKSTLVDLVLALQQPHSGVVRLGGVELDRVRGSELRATTAVAFQEAYLFASTIAENIAVGREVTRAQIEEAAAIAQAAGFVDELAGGYDTVVGERGVTLSGGQRQRLALARAVVGRPRLLVLDDATSAVDPVVEQRILTALREQVAATVLVVAYRLSTIGLADRVVFLSGGQVAAVGTHDELVAVPQYAALIRAYEEKAS